MKCFEVLARRYCALLGEDPDQEIEGVAAWRIALVDLEAAIDALETFGQDARAPMSEKDYDPVDWKHDDDLVPPPTPGKKSADILSFRRVA